MCKFSIVIFLFFTCGAQEYLMSQVTGERRLIQSLNSATDMEEKEKVYVELINDVRRRNLDSADIYIQELMALDINGNCKTCTVQALFMKGHVLFSRDSLQQALETYNKVQYEAKKIDDISTYLLANLRASAVLKRMGRYKEAQGALLNSLRGVKDSIKTQGLKVFVDQVTGDIDEARIKEELMVERRKNREKELQLQNERRIWISSGITLVVIFGGLLIVLIAKRRKEKMELALVSSRMNALRSQMNPHFIFNCVNSIKGLVVSDQNEKAADYLTDFSKLTRKILEISSYDTISLNEELDFLTLYVKAEKQREIVDFEYIISIDERIDTEELRVFPFILQPFIENVVKHAFVDVTRESNALELRVYREDQDWVIFEIEDNGIGVSKKNGHDSKGMQLIEKRLELINKDSNNLSINFRGEGKGTIVKLRLKHN